MDEKLKKEEVSEDVQLTKEQEEAGDLHWKTKPGRVWIPEEGEKVQGEAPVDPAMAEQDEAEVRRLLEEARRRAEEVSEEEMHPEYKKMMGIGVASETEEEREKEIRYGKCGDCGAVVPCEELQDNGSYLACKKCY